MAHVSNKTILTIVIPTYNRHNELIHTLELLLPQLTSECFLLIIDNHSDTLVSESTASVFKRYHDIHYEVRRNNVNIGGNSNIIRCFEYCETEWLWTLGDDDEIARNAIEIILSDIAKYNEVTMINYYSPQQNRPVRSSLVITKGPTEFLQKIDSLGAVMYMSCNVYNRHKLTADDVANHYAYSCMPQVLILWFSMCSDTMVVLETNIVCTNPHINEGNELISLLVPKGWSVLLDIPMGRKNKQLLIKQIKKDTRSRTASIDSVIKKLIIDYKNDPELELKFLYRRYYNIFYSYLGIRGRMKYYFYLLLLCISPELLYQSVRLLYIKKRGIDIRKYVKSLQ
jgi:glycosyltransferase involved in cell wall biosynthesis